MKSIVVDLELTQNKDSKPKIIEIGAVCVHTKTHEVLSTFSELANPGELPDIYITELTHITPEAVSVAKPLRDVLADFWKWCHECGVTKEIASWGEGDVVDLIKASEELGVEHPNPECFDIKKYIRAFRQIRGSKAKGGLANTLTLFGMEFIGTPHIAAHDAYNTARVLFYTEKVIEFAYDTEKRFGPLKINNDHKKFLNSKVRQHGKN